MRTLTVQSGPFSNWTGSHYWSSLEHDATIPQSDYPEFYNETFHGVFEPRLFLVDCADSLGAINLPEPPESEPPTTAPKIEIFDRTLVLPLHPIREAVAQGLTRPSTPIHLPPPNFWTDFWELRNLPTHRQILAQSMCPSETRFRFWFDFPEQTADDLDESKLRTLVEATESSIHTVRILTDNDSAFSRFGMSCSDYLRSCYPKSSALCVSCPPINSSSIPQLVNFAKNFHEEKNLNESSRNIEMFVLPASENKPTHRLNQTGLAAIWMDSVTPRFDSDFAIMTPYLKIDNRSMYRPFGLESDLSYSNLKSRPYHGNIANPIVATPESEIFAGGYSQSTLSPFLESLLSAITLFERDFRAAWEPAVERDEWTEIKNTISNLL
jgi:hypothetical protein